MLGGLTMGSPLRPATRPMMTFVDAVKQCLRKYGDFSGRATRAEFWWWQVFGWIGGLIFGSIDSSIRSFAGGDSYAFSPFGSIFGLAIFLPGLAVQARRLHDIGKTGWWILVWAVLTILGLIPLTIVGVIFIVERLTDSGPGSVISLLLGGLVTFLALLILVVWVIVWMVRQGQDGPNQYGPDPRAWGDEEPEGATAV